MSQIAYDPVKDRFAGIIRNSRFLRRLFYFALDVFFLRSWHVRHTIRKIVKEASGSAPKILDAGSGFGQYDRFLLKLFPDAQITAVDVKEDYLRDCRFYFQKEIKAGTITFEQQDLLEYSKPGFEFVLCVDVLEHIYEDVVVMKNLCDSLKPGGFFLMHSPSHLAEEDAGDDAFFVDEHARAGYSEEELSQKMMQAGLEPFLIKYTYGVLGHAAWVLIIKWPMLLLNRLGFGAVLLLPFWYCLSLIPALIMMKSDVLNQNKTGTGILGLARRPVS